MKKALFLHTFRDIFRFGVTPKKIHGTLVCRGTALVYLHLICKASLHEDIKAWDMITLWYLM